MHQLRLPYDTDGAVDNQDYRQRLIHLLADDLDFRQQDGRYASHSFHAFPARFPPQLPRTCMTALTQPGEVVLDPMSGSGTTVLEALLAGRTGIGFDIDPLSLRITQAKVTPLDVDQLTTLSHTILKQARIAVEESGDTLRASRHKRWDAQTKHFIDYWFAEETQIALLALLEEIDRIEDQPTRAFFELAFSAIIITKSGGVSLAFDLAHTRPHRAKLVLNRTGEVILDDTEATRSPARLKVLTKILRSPFDEFARRVHHNLKGLPPADLTAVPPVIKPGNAQSLPLDDSSVDLIVTSPPYASNAIDYMRAHKFALVWLGYPVADLGAIRKTYIGGETVKDFSFEALPTDVMEVIADITTLDTKKGRVLQRYYSEMTRTLREMFRVLKPGKAAIVVVGSSVMRGKDTKTPECLAEIGQAIGFDVPAIGVRQLDRDKRMLPAGATRNPGSQIQQRMHEEDVIGLYKPELPHAMLSEGRRLRDMSDLPLDLAI